MSIVNVSVGLSQKDFLNAFKRADKNKDGIVTTKESQTAAREFEKKHANDNYLTTFKGAKEWAALTALVDNPDNIDAFDEAGSADPNNPTNSHQITKDQWLAYLPNFKDARADVEKSDGNLTVDVKNGEDSTISGSILAPEPKKTKKTKKTKKMKKAKKNKAQKTEKSHRSERATEIQTLVG